MADESIELEVRLVADGEVAWYNALMAGHHALGTAASGRVLRYVAEYGGVPLVLGTFGSAAWRVPARDAFIGWDPVQRNERLERVVANQRLCVLPAAEAVPHAASRALAAMLRRLPADHVRAFGVRPAAVESFTDPSAHAGTTYKACGFTAAGQTAGYGRSRGAAHFTYHGQPKQYWIRELGPGGIAALTAAFDSRPLTGRAGPDFNVLNVSGDGGLLEYLGRVADHRKPKGIRHGLAAILVVIVVARLSGADSVYACAQFAASMPQEALRRCGIRYNRRLGRYLPPSHKTIKRAVRAVDAAAADEQMCAWLRAETAAGRLRWRWRHIAVDGKTVRGARDGDSGAPHLLSAYDVTAGTVLGQDSVGAKTNEISCFVPLLQAILDGRARRGYDDTRGDGGPGPARSEGGGGGEEEEEEEAEAGGGEGELVIVSADQLCGRPHNWSYERCVAADLPAACISARNTSTAPTGEPPASSSRNGRNASSVAVTDPTSGTTSTARSRPPPSFIMQRTLEAAISPCRANRYQPSASSVNRPTSPVMTPTARSRAHQVIRATASACAG